MFEAQFWRQPARCLLKQATDQELMLAHAAPSNRAQPLQNRFGRIDEHETQQLHAEPSSLRNRSRGDPDTIGNWILGRSSIQLQIEPDLVVRRNDPITPAKSINEQFE